GHGCAAAAAAARLQERVHGGERIPEGARGPASERHAPAHDRDAPFEFVDGHEDVLTVERPKRAFDAVLADEALQISVLASRRVQQPAVDASGMAIDGALDEREKAALTFLEPAPEHEIRLRELDRVTEKAAEADEESRPDQEIGEHAASTTAKPPGV